MSYQLSMQDGSALPWPSEKIVCVGQNYVAHIEEMGSNRVKDPVIFMKPSTALCDLHQPLRLPDFSNDVHHEIELAVIIGKTVRQIAEADVTDHIHAYALAIDLTARDLQKQFKERGHPWELAKAFDGSCPISTCIPTAAVEDPQDVELQLTVNGEIRQSGNTRMMIHSIDKLITFISRHVTLLPGDVLLTGTPEGVGQLKSGDMLECRLGEELTVDTIMN